ncbi:hypothetical protein MtrunA17_Chr4g0033111 [Medicago truncatula]|uniref:Uncharacterized protein n=1 Tax=Medicago truncatula TaxID=3880 RepID=A0A396I8P1_MEDTR|nr:hypothetical protein MtrunA17_Chr4g0033111 [Medicago truncatula]
MSVVSLALLHRQSWVVLHQREVVYLHVLRRLNQSRVQERVWL